MTQIGSEANPVQSNVLLPAKMIDIGTAGSCGIAIMAKASVPGRTKTRLVPPLTFEQAAALNTAFLQDIAGNLLLAGSYAAIAGYVAFAPAGSEEFFRGTLPSAIGLIDACLPNFGDCLLRTSRKYLPAAMPQRSSSIPTVRPCPLRC